jgi:hypothetical protein
VSVQILNDAQIAYSKGHSPNFLISQAVRTQIPKQGYSTVRFRSALLENTFLLPIFLPKYKYFVVNYHMLTLKLIFESQTRGFARGATVRTRN